jgi:hypothetical protein
MEKKLSSYQLLRNLVLAASDPFATDQKLFDIQHILEVSDSFQGVNHLLLVQAYLNEDTLPFSVTKEKAYEQANRALEEGNRKACYYLYLLTKDENKLKARRYLNEGEFFQDPKALLAKGLDLKYGGLFRKNRKQAEQIFLKMISLKSREGYYQLQLMKSEDGDFSSAKIIYEEAKKNGFELPGYISE